jgi:hypothetical protein
VKCRAERLQSLALDALKVIGADSPKDVDPMVHLTCVAVQQCGQNERMRAALEMALAVCEDRMAGSFDDIMRECRAALGTPAKPTE